VDFLTLVRKRDLRKGGGRWFLLAPWWMMIQSLRGGESGADGPKKKSGGSPEDGGGGGDRGKGTEKGFREGGSNSRCELYKGVTDGSGVYLVSITIRGKKEQG